MNVDRIAELLDKNSKSLLTKENPSINLIDVFEIVERIARTFIKDNAVIPYYDAEIKKLQTPFEPILQWITFEDFADKYGFLTAECLYEMRRYSPEFQAMCIQTKRDESDRAKRWHMDERRVLEYFLKRWREKDKTNPNIMNKMTSKVDFMEQELLKFKG